MTDLSRVAEQRSRWWLRAALAAAVAAIAAVVLLLVPAVLESKASRTSAAAMKEATTSGKSSTRARRTELGEIDGDARIQCWKHLDGFDTNVTIASFRAWAGPLIAAGDPMIVEYLADRLAELIGNDEARAREVLGWVGDAQGEEMWLLLEGIKRSDAVHQPGVADAIARVGFAPDAGDELRTAAFASLDSQKQLSPATLQGLSASAFADADLDDHAGWVSARTVGRVMNNAVAAGDNATPYLEQLVAIGSKAPDAQVRSVALEMPMHSDARIDHDTATRLAQIINTDPDSEVRKTAIHDLSLAIDGQQALQIYEQAFPFQGDVCVRWALFRFSARVAGAAALPVMGRMAKLDATFADLHRTFELIYASGVVDFERVWQSLPDEDPVGCLHLHEDEE